VARHYNSKRHTANAVKRPRNLANMLNKSPLKLTPIFKRVAKTVWLQFNCVVFSPNFLGYGDPVVKILRLIVSLELFKSLTSFRRRRRSTRSIPLTPSLKARALKLENYIFSWEYCILHRYQFLSVENRFSASCLRNHRQKCVNRTRRECIISSIVMSAFCYRVL
jgi:hypothetical protein